MPVIQCPIEGCSYATPDVDSIVVAALLTTHSMTHNTSNFNAHTAKVEKVKRPTVSSAGTNEDWTYFESRWNDYKEATKVTGKDLIIQLLECCDDQLRKDLARSTTGSLTNKPENDVLDSMKSLPVRQVNVMVARVTLNNMRQGRDEPYRSFGARLRGQAAVCKYLMPCTHWDEEVNYTDSILRDALSRGIYDTDIQLELLGDMNQNMTLEEIFKFVETKEAGKRSASQLLDSQGAAFSGSSYRKSKRESLKNLNPTEDKSKACSYCGKKGHGKNSLARFRKKDCPAFGHICKHCNKEHHFDDMCRSKNQPKVENNDKHIAEESEGAIFDLLCAVSTTVHRGRKAINLDHHIYNHLAESWIKQQSKAQPFIKLEIKIVQEDYNVIGFNSKYNPRAKATTISVLADTGCQCCLTGINTIHRLGMKEEDLIPVKMKMHAANNRNINILGAVILRLSGKDKHGHILETRQITYVTDNTDKMFISREACIQLGLIAENFPTIGEADNNCKSDIVTHISSHNSVSTIPKECDCPKRTLPPPIPKNLPYHPLEKNKMKLKEWLLDYYKSSTFNICEHQPLPLMEGPKLKLMIVPNAEPTAYHTPIPVPIHWQDETKAGIDRDVKLGVIEPVPIGEPVTWCHRMVVCSKKDGKPRRTVDMQSLNGYAV